jgi:DNA-binding transcriptional LysR family regulator
MLNLYKLEIFALVAKSGSFSRAAEQLLLTQPAVSQHVQDLEASVGAPLFVRGRRGATLTPAGEKLLDYTQRIFALVAEAENAVTDVTKLAGGMVRVGATPGVSVYLLPIWQLEFQSLYPNLTLSVQTGITPEVVAALRSGKLDFGIIEGELSEAQTEGIAVQLLEQVEQQVIVGARHPWWSRSQIRCAELDEQAFIMRQRGSQSRIWLDISLQSCGIHPRVVGEFDNLESIKRAVALGSALTILPAYTVTDEVQAGRLRSLPVENRPLERVLKLIRPESAHLAPVSRAFLEVVARRIPSVEVKPAGKPAEIKTGA